MRLLTVCLLFLSLLFVGCTKSFLDNFNKSIESAPEESPYIPNYFFKKLETNTVKHLYKFPTAILNNKVYFVGQDEEHGDELWVMNKDTTSRRMVKDIFYGNRGSEIFKIYSVGGRLYFWAVHYDYGLELWTSDGTENGTYLLQETYPGQRSLAQRIFIDDFEIVELNGKAYFIFKDDDYGIELWETDGTQAGTRRLSDLVSGYGDSSPRSLVVYEGKVYFIADSDTYGKEIFYYDPNSDLIENLMNLDSATGDSFILGSKILKFSSYLLFTYPSSITENLIVYDNTTMTNYSVNPSGIKIFANMAYYSDDLGNGSEFIEMDAATIGSGTETHNLDSGAGNTCPNNFQQLASGEIVFFWSTGCSMIEDYISISDGSSFAQVFDISATLHFQSIFTVLNNSIVYDSQIKENYIFEMSGTAISNTLDLSDTMIGPTYDGNYLLYQDTNTQQVYLYNAITKTVTAVPDTGFFTYTTIDEVFEVKGGAMYFDVNFTEQRIFHNFNSTLNQFVLSGWKPFTERAGVTETMNNYYIVMTDGSGNYKITKTTKSNYSLTDLDGSISSTTIRLAASNSHSFVYKANMGAGSHIYCYDENTDVSTNISLAEGWNTLTYKIAPFKDGYLFYTGTMVSNRDPYYFTCDNSTNVQLLDEKTNGSSNIDKFIVDEANGLAYFAALDNAGDYNVYVTDGTVVGTNAVPGNLSYTDVQDIYVYQNYLYVCGNRFDRYDLISNREEIFDHVGAGQSGCMNIVGDLESGKLINIVYVSSGQGELYAFDINTDTYTKITSKTGTKYNGYGIYYARIYKNQVFYYINQGDFGGEVWSIADDSGFTQTYRDRSYNNNIVMIRPYDDFGQLFIPLTSIHGSLLLVTPIE
ncbi:MAG: hypothetical protein MK008_07150 [Bdellovibrionales bacterium]|nr:hypothetical protein [Bdellovibrionales bacterium]